LKKGKQRRLISWLLILMIVLNVFSPLNTVWAEGLGISDENAVSADTGTPSNADKDPAATGNEKTDPTKGTPSDADHGLSKGSSGSPKATPSGAMPLLLNAGPQKLIDSAILEPEIEVKKNGSPLNDGDTIINTDTLDIKFKIKVPVKYDTPEPPVYVSKGDTATVELGKGFTLAPSTAVLKTDDGTVIGHATLSANGEGMMTAQILFDWDDSVDDEEDPAINIAAGFNATLKYDESNAETENGKKVIKILEKTFIVTTPAAEIIYNVSKEGTVNWSDNTVEWEVVITATQGGSSVDLEGYKFSDNLAAVGTYKANSLIVGTSSVTPTALSPLTYLFPSGSISPQTVKFKTEIPESKFFSNSEPSITNNAKLLNSDDQSVKEGSDTVKLEKKWITKKHVKTNDGTGDIYNPANRTIEWEIIANQRGADLKGVVITDIADNGQAIDSVELFFSDGSGGWINKVTLTPDAEGKITVGDITTPIRLLVTTKVPDDASGSVSGIKTYNNQAAITWTGVPDGTVIGTGNVGIGVGYNPISKDGTLVGSRSDRQIQWTVTVDPKGQTLASPSQALKVYDLLVYGKDNAGLSGSTGWPEDMNHNSFTPSFNQKYITGSFANTTGTPSLTKVYTIKDSNDAPIADLLEVSVDKNGKNSYTFNSQVVNPAIFAGNETKSVRNTASLFRDTTYLNSNYKDVDITNKILKKDILKRDTEVNDAAGVNGGNIGDADSGFDHETKTAIFRLSVNADSLNFTDAAGINSGAVTITDTLPKGWVFDKTFYKIFEGTTTGGTVNADNDVTGTIGIIPSFTDSNETDGAKASFVFTTLDRPYVILVKAQLTDKAYEEYLQSNDSHKTDLNTVTLSAEKWTHSVTATQDVKIITRVLDKTFKFSEEEARLTWTVDYNPFDLSLTNVKIEDTMSEGMELPVDSAGKPVWDNITITKMVMGSDGKLTAAGDTVNPSTCVTYDAAIRTLTFTVPDVKQAYRLTYITDITLESNGQVKNTVKLTGSEAGGANTGQIHPVTYQSGWATLERGGNLTITKVDGSSPATHLQGAQFTLYAQDGVTVIRKGTTIADGTLKMRAIPVGTYTLKETSAPAGYAPDTNAYTVVVSKGTDNKINTSISGKTGESSNKLTVKNYLDGSAVDSGSLTISKKVVGNADDKTRTFEFKLILSDTANEYFYTGSGVADGFIKSGDPIYLADGQSITITGLPKDITYQVTEENYSGDGYETLSTDESGTIVAGENQTAAFINTKFKPGSLNIIKTVKGNSKETGPFEFTVTFTKPDGTPDGNTYHYSYAGSGETRQIKSGDKISLSHGQIITITGLPKDTHYTVAEKDYSEDGYATSVSGNPSDTIETDAAKAVTFTNTKYIGSLTIKKTVAGNSNETGPFEFIVSFTKPNGSPDVSTYNYSYTGTDEIRQIKSGDRISLSHGQSITITGLLKDTHYTVAEKDYSGSGYTTASDQASGTIDAVTENIATFTNTKLLPGSLTISKTVAGTGASTTKKFDFKVTFTKPDKTIDTAPYKFTGKGEFPADEIKSGDTISLADGESITITGLPDGTGYQVTESDYSSERYTGTKTGDAGTIDTLKTSVAAFTNTYRKPTSGGGGGGGSEPKPQQPSPTTPSGPGISPPTSTPTTAPTQKPREEMTPQELYDIYGEVPLGYMVDVDGQLIPLGLPKTGDAGSGEIAIYVLLCFSAILGLTSSIGILRRKHVDK